MLCEDPKDTTKTKTEATPESRRADDDSGPRPKAGPFGRVTRFCANRKRARKGQQLQALELAVTVGIHPTTALIDSGATHCFVSHSFV